MPRAIPDDPKLAGRLSVRVDGRESFRGRIAIERRGQSSQVFPKKSYGLEIRAAGAEGRDVGLLGQRGPPIAVR